MASIGSGIRVVSYDPQRKFMDEIHHVMFEAVIHFTYYPSCISFIQQNSKDNRLTVVLTTQLEKNVLEMFESLDSVEAVLILSANKKFSKHTMPSKVIGIYPNIEELINGLIETFSVLEYQLDGNSIQFQYDDRGQENPKFYFYDIWKRYGNQSVNNKATLVENCRILFRSQDHLRALINSFQHSYKSPEVLFWLDKYSHPFPYYLLASNALRTHDQQILSVVRFFVMDLSKQMKPLPVSASSNQVYFGTKLPINIIDRLEHQTSTDVISFQCFLPAIKSRMEALKAATKPTRRQKVGNVLFKIDATMCLCANLVDTVLIEMGTPFQVARVTRNAGFGGVQELITVVTLVALPKKTQNEYFERFIRLQKKQGKKIEDFIKQTVPIVSAPRPEVKQRRIQENFTDISGIEVPLYMLSVTPSNEDNLGVSKEEAEGDEFLKMGNYAQAADAYDRVKNPNVRVLNKHGSLLRERLQDPQGALDRHLRALEKATERGRAETFIFLGLAHHDLGQQGDALQCYSQTLRIVDEDKHRDPGISARAYAGMANVYWVQRDLDKALECAKRALVIREKEIRPRNDTDVATSLGNIGNILHDKGDVDTAIVYGRQAVDLLIHCAPGDRRLAAALNNLGAMHQSKGDYIQARDYYKQALESMPTEHLVYRQVAENNIAQIDELIRQQTKEEVSSPT